MTAPLVFAGALCEQWLASRGVRIAVHIQQLADLCDTSFLRADPEADYFLAFLDSCSARMIAIPRDEGADFARMDKAVHRTVEDIKDYLDLDILIAGAETVPDLTAAALPAAL